VTILLALAMLVGQVGTVLVGGTATWYCGNGSACTTGYGPGDAVAAIDTGTGFHKGERVLVTGAAGSRVVRIVDVCACRGSRIIDLTSGMFVAIVGPLSQGTGQVTVEGLPELPPTDVEYWSWPGGGDRDEPSCLGRGIRADWASLAASLLIRPAVRLARHPSGSTGRTAAGNIYRREAARARDAP
jgi:hypothetical protein